jgi:SET domain-containing protein
MLVVRTYIAQSAINGFGVFAYEPIPAGTLVWQFTPGIDLEISEERLAALPISAQEFLRHFINQTAPGMYLLCADNARFMNHSDAPNISSADDRNNALRDIPVGTEIVCDYREFDVGFVGF